MQNRLLLFCLISGTLCGGLSANDKQSAKSEQIAADLKHAISDYSKITTQASSQLLTDIQQRIDKARNDRRMDAQKKLALIDQLETEQKQFKKDGTLPTSKRLARSVRTFSTKVSKARKRCRQAHEDALDAYNKIGDLDSMKKVQKLLNELKESEPEVPNKIQLKSGMVFTGRRRHIINGRPAAELETTITIRSAKDGIFYGTLLIKGVETDRKYTLSGKVKQSEIRFNVNSPRDKFRQTHVGTLSNGVLKVNFQGTGAAGNKVMGQIVARLESK